MTADDLADTREAVRLMYARRFAMVARPRVQYCWMTHRWVVTYDGHRHNCSASFKRDEAFGAWDRAMDAANADYTARWQSMHDAFCEMVGGDWWQ